MLIYPTIAVVQAREWGVPVGDLLELTVPGFVLYGLMAMPWGAWADRAPGSVPIVVGLLGMGAGSIVCGMAESTLGIATGLGLIGFFASSYHPAGLGLITHGVRRSAWALGVNGSFGSGAVALAPGLAEVLSEALGWQTAFLSLGASALVVSGLFALTPIRVELSADEPAAPDVTPTKTGLFTPTFAILCVSMLLGGLAYRGASVIMPALFDERIDWIGHGVATSVAYSLGIVMNYAGGRLAERFEPSRVYLALHAISLPGLLLTAWTFGLPLLLAAAVYAGCALGTQPAENSLVSRLSPPSRRGVAFGVKFTLTFGLGAAAVPVVSRVLESSGTTAVQLTLAGIVAALVLVCVALNRRIQR